MTITLDAARIVALGFCPNCYATGTPVPVLAGRHRCAAHLVDERLLLERTASGQVRLVAPAGARRRPVYATGLQVACVSCSAAGVDRLGMPRDGAGSDPLCVPCWRGRADRRDVGERRRLIGELRERLDVDVQVGCAVCGAAQPMLDCWFCGHAYLAEARAAYEAEVADRAAVEAEVFARLAALTEAEARVADVTGWIERLQAVVSAWTDPKRVGRRGRAVLLTADLLARLTAARTTRRGRPSVTSYVGAVLAVDADYRSGRRALPGRERTAWLIGCSDRAVYNAFVQVEGLGWAKRIRRGGRNSLQRRMETGRPNDRAEHDLAPLHRSPIDPATRALYVPAALELLGELLQRALATLGQEQNALDELRARSETTPHRDELVQRARLRAAVAHIQDTITTLVPDALPDRITCRTHTVSRGEYLSSCLSRGFSISSAIMILSQGCCGQPARRRKGGASRSSTRARRVDRLTDTPQRLQRPRTDQGQEGPSRPARRRPDWTQWAYPLAQALRDRWRWLEALPLPRTAAILGTRLGPRWTAQAVDEWVRRARGRAVLADPREPGAYLCAVLDEAVTSGVEPPHWSRRVEAHQAELAAQRRAVEVERAAVQRQRQEAVRAEAVEREAVAVPASGNAAYQAARAALARRTAPAAAEIEVEAGGWPTAIQPGSGLPVGD